MNIDATGVLSKLMCNFDNYRPFGHFIVRRLQACTANCLVIIIFFREGEQKGQLEDYKNI